MYRNRTRAADALAAARIEQSPLHARSGGDERAANGSAVKSRWGANQAASSVKAAALRPDRSAITTDQTAQSTLALREGFACRSPAQTKNVPPDEHGVRGKLDVEGDVRTRRVEYDAFLWQPLHACGRSCFDTGALLRPCAYRSVPPGRGGRRKQRMRTGIGARAEDELVAARDAPRRMNEDGMADRVAFGVERLLDDKRPFVTTFREDGASAAPFEFERELCAPAADFDRICDVHEPINMHLRIILRAVASRPAPPCPVHDRAR